MTVTSTSAAAASTSGTAGANSLASLAGNFTDFLKLLMTQLQNQDPTSPMDTNQFTSELVQFTSVEQQINTNASLTSLIQATQSGNLLQSSSLVGQTVSYSGDQLSLQNGTAGVSFTAAAPGQVNIDIYDAAGAQVRSASVSSAAGSNTWTWDGTANNGTQLADGAYKVVVTGADGSTVAFNNIGTATGIQRNGSAMDVNVGAVQVDLNNVQSIAARAR